MGNITSGHYPGRFLGVAPRGLLPRPVPRRISQTGQDAEAARDKTSASLCGLNGSTRRRCLVPRTSQGCWARRSPAPPPPRPRPSPAFPAPRSGRRPNRAGEAKSGRVSPAAGSACALPTRGIAPLWRVRPRAPCRLAHRLAAAPRARDAYSPRRPATGPGSPCGGWKRRWPGRMGGRLAHSCLQESRRARVVFFPQHEESRQRGLYYTAALVLATRVGERGPLHAQHNPSPSDTPLRRQPRTPPPP